MIGILNRPEPKYKPHNLIAMLCSLMRDYQLPEGSVNMPLEETAAVVGVILYLLEKEPEISRTKLEYQMLLLDNMHIFEGFEDTDEQHIFHWEQQMKNSRPNLEGILNFMELKGLIAQKRKRFYVKKHGVISEGKIQNKVLNWLNSISEKLYGHSADESGRKVRQWIKERTL